jgi:hypothetical protein
MFIVDRTRAKEKGETLKASKGLASSFLRLTAYALLFTLKRLFCFSGGRRHLQVLTFRVRFGVGKFILEVQ